jgi:putative ABC transport system substrate-binding protein
MRLLLALALLVLPLAAQAQQGRVYRIGVVLHGGTYSTAIDGMRDGLKAFGFEESKHYLLHVRETKGDIKAVAGAARSLEAEKVDLIFSMATSVSLEAKRATKSVPMVFYAGTDPVALGLVDSFRKPGGRLTGIYGRFTDITEKRIELLKTLVPKLQRIVTFHNPENPNAGRALKQAREAARQLKLELIEIEVRSVEQFRAALQAYKPGKADGFSYLSDAMMISQIGLLIEAAKAKRMPAIFADRANVVAGGLASYGQSYYTLGKLCAGPIHKVLLGANPGELPVEQLDRLDFVVNLKAAKALGITIPQAVLARADEVIE